MLDSFMYSWFGAFYRSTELMCLTSS